MSPEIRNRPVITIRIEIHIIQPDALDTAESSQEGCTAVCEECGWTRDYSSKARQKRGLAAHQHHCPGPMNIDMGGKLSKEVERYFEKNGTTTIAPRGHKD